MKIPTIEYTLEFKKIFAGMKHHQSH